MFSGRPAPYFNLSRVPQRRWSVGSSIRMNKLHTTRLYWWKVHYYSPKPEHIDKHYEMPRIYLDRNIFGLPWQLSRNLPDENRWEKVYNSMRYSVERVHWVEEEGLRHRVNWKLYSDRVNAELQTAVDALPQYSICMKAVPMSWRKLDISLSRIRGLSVREAVAQCKLGFGKGNNVLYRALEKLLKGAETKGLDKEKLRLGKCGVALGPTDRQIDLKSKGYYSWKTKKACHLFMTAVEDPEMRLPDRTKLPYTSTVGLRRAGITSEPIVLDVPAITAEGI